MKRHGRYNNQGTGLAMLLVVVVLAVFSGYMGTKFIIEPYFLADRQPAPEVGDPDGNLSDTGEESSSPDNSGVVSGGQDITDVAPQDNGAGVNPAEQNTADISLPDPQPVQVVEPQADPASDAATPEETVPTTVAASGSGSLYCIQFGSFSTEGAAETAVKELTEKDVATYVQPRDGSYKVLSLPYESREKALEAAEAIKDKVEDVFVVAM